MAGPVQRRNRRRDNDQRVVCLARLNRRRRHAGRPCSGKGRRTTSQRSRRQPASRAGESAGTESAVRGIEADVRLVRGGAAAMIITRSPLRISLGGGGTDLPSYYEKFGGFLIAAAIDRYVYVTINRPFGAGIRLKYSDIENVDTVDEVRHPILREALRMMNLRTPQIEITTLAEIPSGTGLGSSGSFTTALVKALYAHRRRLLHSSEVARLACEIEIERLHEPVGKQDQYIAAYGGMTCFDFNPDGSVTARPLVISMQTLWDLEDNLLLFFTGFARSAGSILEEQKTR